MHSARKPSKRALGKRKKRQAESETAAMRQLSRKAAKLPAGLGATAEGRRCAFKHDRNSDVAAARLGYGRAPAAVSGMTVGSEGSSRFKTPLRG